MINKQVFKPYRGKSLKIAVTVIAWLVAGIGLAYAVELPVADSAAFLQTTGPNADLGVGDFYTNTEGANDNHIVEINVPCSWPGDLPITFALFDPESTGGEFAGPPPVVDEQRGGADDITTFTLTAADGAVVGPINFDPAGGSDGLWVELVTATPNTAGFGCGLYTLTTSTADDDDNAWRLKANHDPDCDAGACSGISAAASDLLSNNEEDDDPDNIPGSGDELEIALVQSSFQHFGRGQPCQDFFFFVDGQTSPLTLNNFDMDGGGRLTYFLPDGTEVGGDESGATVWNGGTRTERGGDEFDIDPSLVGWWRAEICIPDDNQYIFEAQEGEPIYFSQPGTPIMVLSKDDGKTVVTPGELITHTIVFTNVSDTTTTPGAATNVTLVDTLPAGVTFQDCNIDALSTLYPGTTCTPGAGTVTVQLTENVIPGGGGSFDVIVSVDADASDTLTNTVTLDYQDTLGRQLAPVEATDQTLIPPDLTLNKTDSGISTVPGGTIIYTLTYTNISNTGATGVTIGDLLPDNTTFNAAASTPGWSCAASTCTLLVGDVAGNQGGSVLFAVDVDDPLPAGVTAITNNAGITDDGTNGPDPTPQNNIANDNTPLNMAPDMSLAKTDGGITTSPGGTVVYTLSYTNTGTIDANNVTITETVPTNTTFSALASSPTAWSCADGSGPAAVCTINVGTVAANGGSGSVTFGIVVDSPLSPSITGITNSAVIGDDSGLDPTPANNVANDDTPIEIVDPQITKSVDPGEADIGDTINFSITVSNPSTNSNAPAQNVVLTDPLPREYNYVSSAVSSNPSGVIFTPPDVITGVISTAPHSSGITQTVATTLTVDIPVLAVDESVTLAVVATINGLASPRPFNIANQATLDFDGGPRKTADAQVVVPAPDGSPSRPDRDDDDDDDGGSTASSPPPSSPSVNPAAAPQPTAAPPLPVLLLPETGRNDGQSAISPAILALWTIIALGACLLLWNSRKLVRTLLKKE